MDATGTPRRVVLINDEEQYGIYPDGRPIPPGWRTAGFTGSEDECARYVDEYWTDMRPLSLRQELGR
ncbi:MbtH family protein [Amycolatopsis sp. cmx-11-12]|uniref:MbtH family protein n=1 Tax=Amycolatopsis sp. cmx-11-12 TaxID=2785795 RepID=UPI003917377C